MVDHYEAVWRGGGKGTGEGRYTLPALLCTLLLCYMLYYLPRHPRNCPPPP